MSDMHSDTVVQTPGHGEPSFSTKAIWRTFWILSVITVVELALAILYYKTDFLPKHFLNGIFVIGTLAKAFFIIAEFMHLGHEIKNLILSLAMPALLFVWFIIAFLWDGNSFKNLRNDYDRHHFEQSKTKAPAPEAKKSGAAD
ncbi:MAG TPA: cytochrome C oxidase subunit IV family protein [Puia sp.]|jgi:cytochrome c oxidase subunit IV|nr:cytochrome C oxidase subunit IV family protein [Puia sp.]